MIILESRDSYIWNIERKIIEIIKEAISHEEKIVIDTNLEGPCLRACGFYDLLDQISASLSIDITRFEIHTSNVEEFHDRYKVVIKPNVWIKASASYADLVVKKQNLKHVGCFVGKLNWPRLSLLAWLDQYTDQVKLTCHYVADDQTSQAALQLNEIMFFLPSIMPHAVEFLKTCPRLPPSGFAIPYHRVRTMNLPEISAMVAGMAENYDKIFLELVCETYFSGFSFFPTEKTFRPIQRLTPFIIFGPKGFLSNLKRCGFQTFDRWWDESYDDCQSQDRITKIQSVLSTLFAYSQSDLQIMYQEMMPVLLHNKERLSKLQADDLLFDTQKNDE